MPPSLYALVPTLKLLVTWYASNNIITMATAWLSAVVFTASEQAFIQYGVVYLSSHNVTIRRRVKIPLKENILELCI